MDIDFFAEDEIANSALEKLEQLRVALQTPQWDEEAKGWSFPVPVLLKEDEEPYITLRAHNVPYKTPLNYPGAAHPEVHFNEVLQALDRAGLKREIDNLVKGWNYYQGDPRSQDGRCVQANFDGVNGEQCRVRWVFNRLGELRDVLMITKRG